ncbi:hypothetical protein [Bosea sp. BIWAKO-01]|uniref:hypothetical protein n=1 Tax=Bosea sp. BIWAKO-01 TaxID=506668 RepID=UPI000852B648|nr:hypothetical protein [Bosea sp. BIWAKO-01]GAU85946.1 hypothetical protein BIWAKO_05894 [Bosea sp. BIWAKO-01]
MLPRGEYVALPEEHPTANETIEKIDIPLGRPIEISGHIKAADTINYLFPAVSYDTVWISLSASSKRCAFNVYSPDGEAIYNGWADGPEWGDNLHRTGEFRIEVYIGFKSERGEEASFTLRIERSDD